MRKRTLLYTAIFVLIFSGFCSVAFAGQTTVHSIYVSLPEHVDILMDGGDSNHSNTVVNYPNRQDVDYSELLIETHLKSDLPACTNNNICTGISNSNFTITSPKVTVISPNGGEFWTKGRTQTITWVYEGKPSKFKIELMKNGKAVKTIASHASIGTGGSGSYNWRLPTSLKDGVDYQIRLTSTSAKTCTDTSDDNFIIATTNKQTTRALLAYLLVNKLSLPTFIPETPYFSDVPLDYWAAGYIYELHKEGLLNGYEDGTFRPENGVNRAEFCCILFNAFNVPLFNPEYPTFTDVPQDHWAYNYIESLVHANVIKGYEDGTFRPERYTKLHEAITVFQSEALE